MEHVIFNDHKQAFFLDSSWTEQIFVNAAQFYRRNYYDYPFQIKEVFSIKKNRINRIESSQIEKDEISRQFLKNF